MANKKYGPKGITDEQILEAMKPFLATPSLWEIARRVGLKSHQPIWARMKRLIKEGKVVKKDCSYKKGCSYWRVFENKNVLDGMDLSGSSDLLELKKLEGGG